MDSGRGSHLPPGWLELSLRLRGVQPPTGPVASGGESWPVLLTTLFFSEENRFWWLPKASHIKIRL